MQIPKNPKHFKKMGPGGIHCACCVDVGPTRRTGSLRVVKQFLSRLFRRKTKQAIKEGAE